LLERNKIELFDPEKKSSPVTNQLGKELAVQSTRELTDRVEPDKSEVEAEFKRTDSGRDAAVLDPKAEETVRARGAVRRKMETPADAAKQAEVAQQKQDPADGLELYIVNASRAQIDAALGELGAADDFRVVQVTSASPPGPMSGTSALGIGNSVEATNGAAATVPPAASAPAGGVGGGGGALQSTLQDRSGQAQSADDKQKQESVTGKRSEPARPTDGREGTERAGMAGQRPNAERKAAGADPLATSSPKLQADKPESTAEPKAAPARVVPDARFQRARTPAPDGDKVGKPLSSQTAPTNEKSQSLLKARSEEKEDLPQADTKDVEGFNRPAVKKQTDKTEDLRANEPSAPAEQPPAELDTRQKIKQATEEAGESSAGALAGRASSGADGGESARGRSAGGAGFGAARGGGVRGQAGFGGSGYGNAGDGAFRGGYGATFAPSGPQEGLAPMPAGSATRVRLTGRTSTLGLADEKALADLKLRSAIERTKGINGQTAAGEAVQELKQPSDAYGARIAKENLAKDTPLPQLETQARSFGTAGISPDQNQGVDPRAPQQVLFFFRIVDAPLAKAAIQAEAGQAERAKAAIQGGVKLQDRDSTPVPAPAAPK
jgi:hypothetical protein